MTEENKERQQGQSLITPGYEVGSLYCGGCRGRTVRNFGSSICHIFGVVVTGLLTDPDYSRCKSCIESEQKAKGMIPRGEVEELLISIENTPITQVYKEVGVESDDMRVYIMGEIRLFLSKIKETK